MSWACLGTKPDEIEQSLCAHAEVAIQESLPRVAKWLADECGVPPDRIPLYMAKAERLIRAQSEGEIVKIMKSVLAR